MTHVASCGPKVGLLCHNKASIYDLLTPKLKVYAQNMQRQFTVSHHHIEHGPARKPQGGVAIPPPFRQKKRHRGSVPSVSREETRSIPTGAAVPLKGPQKEHGKCAATCRLESACYFIPLCIELWGEHELTQARGFQLDSFALSASLALEAQPAGRFAPSPTLP